MLRDREYYSTSTSNCWSLEGAPNCAANRQTCEEACAPTYTAACRSSCEATFQTCCAGNDRTRAERAYDACVGKCSALPAPASLPPSSALMFSTAEGARLAYELAPWGQPKLEAWEAYRALRPAAERATDDVRRKAAFDEVWAHMKQTGAGYAVVSGGGGRLWVLRPDGTAALMSTDIAAYMRRGADGEHGPVSDLLGPRLGLTKEETLKLLLTVRLFNNFGHAFRSGQVLYFHPDKSGADGAPIQIGSTEHATIRGTINGGGDFI
jgi:hypothetical protein